jgi:hypothetical protein
MPGSPAILANEAAGAASKTENAKAILTAVPDMTSLYY